ncbi:Asp-tRNA(Asn)/Glu-tRNA(Gln) amidotransferase subunit GatA [Fluviicola sp.]|jgi:aspartyl-tRNA(Asn)/glutamyl-tRNA(Gln) amidotransferase subunit A|uniref:Asp-tRNA(Asn)/Glu-tRNA(Gln) amidotransferase subunit GatA n=1 Tax=Fluviicola sp. TaxID=1917219 RepID=UPI0028269EA6|nr:Asp-tRNA(Asn)/Glu-tRNA(Gln) amidotransferase subunit GatA [Fluviicola sp.]MDR0801501.1 Asp-tRNA(Asn)/Glu-tRNA(Gln) amidotransferase subunit GatA [Fluviicola sp.]
MYKTFSEVKVALSGGKTVESIVRSYLDQIEKHKDLNAFLEVFAESAVNQAQVVDQKLASGNAGRLAGMVIGLKDNICYKDHAVSASSKILKGFESLYSATAVEKLLAEDAIIIGRLNCDEFAMGSSNENSAFGPVKNNLRPTHVPGGSSGGSAVAVSAGLCTVTLGSDTGGSIRQPASFTGTVGLKPTYGRVSRYGLIAYASSFDQIGPFANNLEDVVMVMEIMAGKDPKDATSSSRPLGFSTEIPAIGKKKIAYLNEALENKNVDPEVRSMMEKTIEDLRAKGHIVESVSFPYLEYLVPTYYVLTTAEASSNLSRFDGVHYGYQSPEAKGVEETYTLSRSEGFGTEVKRRIMAGTFVLSHGYYDAYYTKGMKVRRVLKNKTKEIFNKYDLLILPTTPSTAFEFGSINDPIQMYLQDIFTVHANLTGNPAIAIPNGTHSNGLPLSLQIMADDFNEEALFSLADQIMYH